MQLRHTGSREPVSADVLGTLCGLYENHRPQQMHALVANT
jgi:hypothetical protein